MLKNRKGAALALMACTMGLLAFTGCGSDRPGSEAAYQQGSNTCSDAIMADRDQYQKDVSAARIACADSTASGANLDACRQALTNLKAEAQGLKQKYADAICVDPESKQKVNVNEGLDNEMNAIDQYLNQLGNNPARR